jgi:hypothetical protein
MKLWKLAVGFAALFQFVLMALILISGWLPEGLLHWPERSEWLLVPGIKLLPTLRIPVRGKLLCTVGASIDCIEDQSGSAFSNCLSGVVIAAKGKSPKGE